MMLPLSAAAVVGAVGVLSHLWSGTGDEADIEEWTKNVEGSSHGRCARHVRTGRALVRRGLAAELAGMVSFEAHETLRMALIKAMTDDAQDRPDAVPLDQVRTPDKLLWKLLDQAAMS